MTHFVEVAKVARLRARRVVTVKAPHGPVAIVDVRGHVFALQAHCIRCTSRLAAGALAGYTLTCRRCGWRYDVRTGEVIGIPSLRLEMYAVKIAGSSVMLGDTFLPRKRS